MGVSQALSTTMARLPLVGLGFTRSNGVRGSKLTATGRDGSAYFHEKIDPRGPVLTLREPPEGGVQTLGIGLSDREALRVCRNTDAVVAHRRVKTLPWPVRSTDGSYVRERVPVVVTRSSSGGVDLAPLAANAPGRSIHPRTLADILEGVRDVDMGSFLREEPRQRYEFRLQVLNALMGTPGVLDEEEKKWAGMGMTRLRCERDPEITPACMSTVIVDLRRVVEAAVDGSPFEDVEDEVRRLRQVPGLGGAGIGAFLDTSVVPSLATPEFDAEGDVRPRRPVFA